MTSRPRNTRNSSDTDDDDTMKKHAKSVQRYSFSCRRILIVALVLILALRFLFHYALTGFSFGNDKRKMQSIEEIEQQPGVTDLAIPVSDQKSFLERLDLLQSSAVDGPSTPRILFQYTATHGWVLSRRPILAKGATLSPTFYPPDASLQGQPLSFRLRKVTNEPLKDLFENELTCQARARFVQSHLPTLACPDRERVGGFGDGGKWICQPRKWLQSGQCIVYSFGSHLEIGFEEHLQRLVQESSSVHDVQGCEIHIFDPTPSVERGMKSLNLPPRTQYYPWGLGASGQSLELEGRKVPIFSLDEVIQRLNHSFIDILKIDIEGSEFDMLDAVKDQLQTIWYQKTKIGQLQIEIHLPWRHSVGPGDVEATRKFAKWIHMLEYQFGFRLFRTEVNENGILNWEFAFLNPSYKPAHTDKTLLTLLQESPYDDTLQLAAMKDALMERDKYRMTVLPIAERAVKSNQHTRQMDHLIQTPFWTWLHDAVISCRQEHFLGQARFGGRYYCDDWRESGTRLQLLALFDATYLFAEPSLPKVPLVWPENQGLPLVGYASASLPPRFSFLHDLTLVFPDMLADVYALPFRSAKDAVLALKSYLESDASPGYNMVYVALQGYDAMLGYLELFPLLAKRRIGLVLIDLHFCDTCTAPVTPDANDAQMALLYDRFIMTAQQSHYKLYRKEALMSDLTSDTFPAQGHYSLEFLFQS